MTAKASSSFATRPPVHCFTNFDKALQSLRALARRQQPDDKLFIQAEIQRLFNEGKIQPCNSPWRSQVFVVREPNRKPRMVVDYLQNINRLTTLDAFPIPLVSELLDQVSQ